MNKIQQIEEVVRKECPWLMDLSFGCEVEICNILGWKYRATIISIKQNPEDFTDKEFIVFVDGKLKKQHSGNIFKVIGHPIHLEHILYVIGIKQSENPKLELWSNQLEFFMRKDDKNNIMYNLTLPFKDQSEEVINFLHKIICKK